MATNFLAFFSLKDGMFLSLESRQALSQYNMAEVMLCHFLGSDLEKHSFYFLSVRSLALWEASHPIRSSS